MEISIRRSKKILNFSISSIIILYSFSDLCKAVLLNSTRLETGTRDNTVWNSINLQLLKTSVILSLSSALPFVQLYGKMLKKERKFPLDLVL